MGTVGAVPKLEGIETEGKGREEGDERGDAVGIGTAAIGGGN